jgi:hypothetical protein
MTATHRSRVLLTASHLYWTDAASGACCTGTIVQADLAGSSPRTLASGQHSPAKGDGRPAMSSDLATAQFADGKS